ncbi:hypothetical protein [Prevotella falsenii]
MGRFPLAFSSGQTSCGRPVWSLPVSAQPLHLDVAGYAFDETPAHLLDNRTK